MNFGETDCKNLSYSRDCATVQCGKRRNMRLKFESFNLQTKRFIEIMKRFLFYISTGDVFVKNSDIKYHPDRSRRQSGRI